MAPEQTTTGPRAHERGRPELHIFFIVDCSGSMWGEKIASLNYAMRSALPALKAAAADHPNNDTFVRVMRFADTPAWVNEPDIPVAQFEWQDLSAGGETSLGAALDQLASALSDDALAQPQLPPVIILMSDGLPTDDVNAGIERLKSTTHGASAIRIAVAIGSDADMPSLQKFIGATNVRPLRANSAETLVSSIKWAASEPVAAASQIADGIPAALDSVTEKLNDGIVQHNNTDESFVW